MQVREAIERIQKMQKWSRDRAARDMDSRVREEAERDFLALRLAEVALEAIN